VAFGHNRIIITMPTGMGKTVTAAELARSKIDAGGKVIVYTNRLFMIDQLSDAMDAAGIAHGIRHGDYMGEAHHHLQIGSLPTEHSQVIRQQKRDVFPADWVFVDEGHLHTGASSQAVIEEHLAQKAKVFYLTATPIGMGGVADELIVAGTNSEGRACGALVPAMHFGPDEPDLSKIGRTSIDDLGNITEEEVRKVMMVPGIFGRVWDWYNQLNPKRLPTILFAPGVPESLWFAEQFAANGVSAAHIDGEEVWINGEVYRNDRKARERAIAASRSGEVGILCNRFVLREGIDAPWLAHGIFATVFSSLQSYLQSGGRLLRSHPGLQRVTIQDHGGNWHRHRSLNQDRDWDFTLNAHKLAKMQDERYREKKDPEPWRCPRCGQIMMGLRCQCGYEFDLKKKARPVAQADGTLIQHYGDIYNPRKFEKRDDTEALWIKEYWRARNAKRRLMNFNQALGNFFRQHGYFPPKDLPLMPSDPQDWVKDVALLPMDRLTSVPPRKGRKKKDGPK
jgi:superfamily II DNA or RNA helicase